MTTNEIPGWPAVGMAAWEYIPGNNGGGRLEAATIKTIGSKYVVLTNGNRYRLAGLTRNVEHANASGHFITATLLHADDPIVADVKRHNRMAYVRRAIRQRSEEMAALTGGSTTAMVRTETPRPGLLSLQPADALTRMTEISSELAALVAAYDRLFNKEA